MYKLLILLLLPIHAFADVIDWTRKGYFVVKDPQGQFVSRHTTKDYAMASAANHAFNSGNTGQMAYIIESPFFEVLVTVPGVASTEPPPPPPPPEDDGSDLDPNSVYACDDGAGGTTVEPDGIDSNTGRMVEGVVYPVKSLARLEQLAQASPDGVDYRLCEGGVWKRQSLTIRKSGDIGEHNKVILRGYRSSQAAQRWGDAGKWMYAHHPDLFKGRIPTPAHKTLSGWRPDDVNPVKLGCYKILNGVPRPCMNEHSICMSEGERNCLEPDTLRLRS